ncbi:hypothetical protein CN1A_70 [Clavibacter phage CN1A]|uniref:Uncharacterized protein n=1 Tax=Clavibacter phage CN1A TaxID=1406793 RepID=U5PTH1_9CAUD|nr:hypothetical protein CN1A_70 [Clavibacter phage CN1A]AGY47179.1 hypothetical protein CN1A_70 [Clavibacter phage CN1A]
MYKPPILGISHFNLWLATGERGISSEAIVTQLSGVPIGRDYGFGTQPHDPSDFRRCELLLRMVPEARPHLERMRLVSPEWNALVEHWDTIVKLAEAENPTAFTRRASRTAVGAGRLIRDLLDSARP